MSPWVSLRFLQTQSDARLLAAAQQGHERAFEALVQRYRRPLLRYCQRMLGSEARAEDALQQALLQAWAALEKGVEVRDVKAWLYRIAHNSALDVVRRSGAEQVELSEALVGGESAAVSAERDIRFRETMEGVAALPELQREALLRTAVDGDSHEHVAQTLGLSEGAVRGLIYRARASLRAAATAITPSPLFAWALNTSPQSTTIAARIAEVGGGSAGVAGLLVKGGAVVVTAGALVAGGAVVHHAIARPRPHRHVVPRPAGPVQTARAAAVNPLHTAATRASGSAPPPRRRQQQQGRPPQGQGSGSPPPSGNGGQQPQQQFQPQQQQQQPSQQGGSGTTPPPQQSSGQQPGGGSGSPPPQQQQQQPPATQQPQGGGSQQPPPQGGGQSPSGQHP
jgi:RNA polymerase sigma factor (sigma-70 family)